MKGLSLSQKMTEIGDYMVDCDGYRGTKFPIILHFLTFVFRFLSIFSHAASHIFLFLRLQGYLASRISNMNRKQ